MHGGALDVDLLRELTTKGAEKFEAALVEAADILVPNPDVDIVEWIESNIIIPPSVSPTRPGPIKLTIVQRLIARRMQKRGVKRVAFLKTPRMGSTLFNVAMLLYYACHKGVDVIFYERTDPQAQDFHDKKLYPIMIASPKIRAMMRPDGKHGVQDKWSDRILSNGAAVQLRSGFGDGSARAIKGEFLGIDEASSKEFQPGKTEGEGNKVEKIYARALEFAAPIMYVGGTPTNEATCVTSQEYKKGDRCVIEMKFPCCGKYQEFIDDVQRVASKDERKGGGIRYTQDDDGRVTDVWYECQNPDCRECVPETQKSLMFETGRLRETATPIDDHYSSVFAWMVYSEDPQGDWLSIAQFHRNQLLDPSLRQPWNNLWLGRAYIEEPPRVIPVSELEKRATEYGADAPEYVTDVFGGLDNQQGGLSNVARGELLFYGAGANQRRGVIRREIISHYNHIHPDGSVELVPAEPFTKPWMELVWKAIDKPITTADGRVLKVTRVGVDVGWRMHEALLFCHHPESRKRGIFPVRGRRETGTRVPILPSSMSKHFKSSMQFAMVSGQTAKDYLYDSFQKPAGTAHSWDFPDDTALLGEDFYEQVLSEGPVETRPGSKQFMWEQIDKSKPNEMIDCLVYGLCAELYSCKRSSELRKRLAVQMGEQENVRFFPGSQQSQTSAETEDQEASVPIAETEDVTEPEKVTLSRSTSTPRRAKRVQEEQPIERHRYEVDRKPRRRRRAAMLDW